MAKPGFEERFRECLGSEEFEEKIDNFLKRKALLVLQESELPESKDDDGFHGGEFSLKAHRLIMIIIIIILLFSYSFSYLF